AQDVLPLDVIDPARAARLLRRPLHAEPVAPIEEARIHRPDRLAAGFGRAWQIGEGIAAPADAVLGLHQDAALALHLWVEGADQARGSSADDGHIDVLSERGTRQRRGTDQSERGAPRDHSKLRATRKPK